MRNFQGIMFIWTRTHRETFKSALVYLWPLNSTICQTNNLSNPIQYLSKNDLSNKKSFWSTICQTNNLSNQRSVILESSQMSNLSNKPTLKSNFLSNLQSLKSPICPTSNISIQQSAKRRISQTNNL